MLANSRSYSLLCLLIAISFVVSVPAVAQVHGVPASVTSLGFGGNDNPAPGPRASVTSLGPNGYAPAFWGNCCSNFFLPSGDWPYGPEPSVSTGHHRHHRNDVAYVPVAVPAYIPYGTAYAAESDEDDAAGDASRYDYTGGYTPGSGPPKQTVAAKGSRQRSSDGTPDDDSAAKAAASEQPEEPVAAQPSTVLVFRDGHRSDVVNYAIVGDTLFDFAEGRTHKILLADLDLAATQKANDERGVEFKVPQTGK